MTNTPADTYSDLKAKLREMFQMDQADLDFGIYRIMNAKRDEISDYLDNHLQPQVKEILQEVATDDSENLDGKIEKACGYLNRMQVLNQRLRQDTKSYLPKKPKKLTSPRWSARYSRTYTVFSHGTMKVGIFYPCADIRRGFMPSLMRGRR